MTPRSTSNTRKKSFWSSTQWDAKDAVLDPVQKMCDGMERTQRSRRSVLANRRGSGFLNMEPAQDLEKTWDVQDCGLCLDGNAVLDRADDRGELCSSKWMRITTFRSRSRGCFGNHEELPQSKQCKGRALSPRARLERRLGDRALLHNGSVPSLYWMLTPAPRSEHLHRLPRFPIRSRSAIARSPAKRLFATRAKPCSRRDETPTVRRSRQQRSRIAGGHAGPRIIGRKLNETSRYDLIEY